MSNIRVVSATIVPEPGRLIVRFQIRNTINFTGSNTVIPETDCYPTTGNYSVTTYTDASGTATLAIYFVGYGTNNVYFVETIDPSSSDNWSQPVQLDAPLPQGVPIPGITAAGETYASWVVAVLNGTPGEWIGITG